MADDSDASEKEVNLCITNLPPSELGTKKYWDQTYSSELDNFQDNGDVGEIWFGKTSINRIVKWIDSCHQLTKSSSVLDVGCGNGMLLVNLAQKGYTSLTGVDYSSKAIELASSIAVEEHVGINYMVFDILDESNSSVLGTGRKFDLCLDKGTYDAVSLNPKDAEGCRAKYIHRVSSLLAPDGLFIICSCNWTKSELMSQFQSELDFLEAIPPPTLSFGGQSGSTVTTLVFAARTT